MKATVVRDDIRINEQCAEGVEVLRSRAGLPRGVTVKVILEALRERPHPDLYVKQVTRKTQFGSSFILAAFWNPGAVIEFPDCYWAVRHGWAVPADDECRDAAGMTEEQLQAAMKLYPKIAAGIVPADYDLYDAGVITGYTAIDSLVPGVDMVIRTQFTPGPHWDKRHELFPQRFAPNGQEIRRADYDEEDDDDDD